MNEAPSWPARARNVANHEWVRAVGATIGSRFGALTVGLASTIILARTLGPTGRGFYAAALTTATLVVIVGTAGLHAANTSVAGANRTVLAALVANSLVAAAVVTALALVAFFVLAAVEPDVLPVRGELALLALVWVPLSLSFTLLHPLLLVLNRVRTHNLLELGWQLGVVVLICVLWATARLTPSSAFVANIVALGIAVAAIVGVLRRDAGRPIRTSRAVFRQSLGYSLRAYLLSITGFALLRIDIVMIDRIRGPHEVGLYTVAAAAGEVVMIAPAAIGALLFARLSRQSDEAVKWGFTRRVLGVTAAAMAVACTGVLLMGRPMIHVLYGSDFVASFDAVRALVPGYFFGGINSVLTYYFLSVGMPPLIVGLQGASVVLNIVLNVVLLPDSGIVGASIASSITYGALCAAQLVVVMSRVTQVRPVHR